MRCAVIVIAKAPRAGFSKTRLTPPCSPAEAAGIAEASLIDTLDAVARSGATRCFLALEGTAGRWVPLGFTVFPQRGHRLDERLAAAFEDAACPALLVGMDTPQITPGLLEASAALLMAEGTDAVLGPTFDGGWWCIGLTEPNNRVFLGVPMSTPGTGVAQATRLNDLGLRCSPLPVMNDVDHFDDALAVANQIPGSFFAETVQRVRDEHLLTQA